MGCYVGVMCGGVICEGVMCEGVMCEVLSVWCHS